MPHSLTLLTKKTSLKTLSLTHILTNDTTQTNKQKHKGTTHVHLTVHDDLFTYNRCDRSITDDLSATTITYSGVRNPAKPITNTFGHTKLLGE